MIYTVTFNPALDYVIRVDKLRPGCVNRTSSEELFFGGKGINVSIVLNNLGLESIALGYLAGFTGRAIESGLSSMNIRTDFIYLEEGTNRINIKICSGEETEINGKGPDISREALEKLLSKLDCLKENDILVLAGSIPHSLSDNTYEEIMSRLKNKNIEILVDATGDLLLNVLKHHPFLIKPNNHELEEIFGITLKNDSDIEYHAKELQRLGARNVLVSMAEKGAILVTEYGKYYKMDAPKGKVINSVGAGDSMVAGFLAGYLEKNDFEYALKTGIAAGSATVFSGGLVKKDEYDNILSGKNILRR